MRRGELGPVLEEARRGRPIVVEVAAGELVDKLTILEIKAARLRDESKLGHVRDELAAVRAAYVRSVEPSEELEALVGELRSVNERLWEVEEEIRVREREGDFGGRFVELAREVCRRNDRRAAIKRRVNETLGSRHVEEKSYVG